MKNRVFNIDVDNIIATATSPTAPVYRALTVTDLGCVTTVLPTYGRQRKPWRRQNIYLVSGKSSVNSLAQGTTVIIDTAWRGAWRIMPSRTGESTPLRLAQGVSAPAKAEKIAECNGFVVFQTAESIYEAALYQQERDRRAIAIPMINQAIVLVAKHAAPETVAEMEKTYMKFRKTAALALSPGTDGEGTAALRACLKLASGLIERGTTQ